MASPLTEGAPVTEHTVVSVTVQWLLTLPSASTSLDKRRDKMEASGRATTLLAFTFAGFPRPPPPGQKETGRMALCNSPLSHACPSTALVFCLTEPSVLGTARRATVIQESRLGDRLFCP